MSYMDFVYCLFGTSVFVLTLAMAYLSLKWLIEAVSDIIDNSNKDK